MSKIRFCTKSQLFYPGVVDLNSLTCLLQAVVLQDEFEVFCGGTGSGTSAEDLEGLVDDELRGLQLAPPVLIDAFAPELRVTLLATLDPPVSQARGF